MTKRKHKQDRRRFEYPDPTPVSTPVSFRGKALPQADFRRFVHDWSQSQAEANHVETFEEANDFEVYDPEDHDFFHGMTPYEMHDMPEDTPDSRLDAGQPAPAEASAESNETEPTGAAPLSQDDETHP